MSTAIWISPPSHPHARAGARTSIWKSKFAKPMMRPSSSPGCTRPPTLAPQSCSILRRSRTTPTPCGTPPRRCLQPISHLSRFTSRTRRRGRFSVTTASFPVLRPERLPVLDSIPTAWRCRRSPASSRLRAHPVVGSAQQFFAGPFQARRLANFIKDDEPQHGPACFLIGAHRGQEFIPAPGNVLRWQPDERKLFAVARHVGFAQDTGPLRQLGCINTSHSYGIAVAPLVVLDEFNRVRESVPVVQDLPQAGLSQVLAHNFSLHRDCPAHDLF